MSSLTGQPLGIAAPILGIVGRRAPGRGQGRTWVYPVRSPADLARAIRPRVRRRLAALLAGPEVDGCALNDIPTVTGLPAEGLAALHDGDILQIEPSGRVIVFFEKGSPHNCIFATNRCNCLCVMCPQPPGPDPEGLWEQNLRLIDLMDPKEVTCLAITGGEPTLLGERLVELIRLCRQKVPRAHLTLLTNARKFKNFNFAKAVVQAGYPALLLEVPLFADNDTEHDRVMGAGGAFWDTIQGLHNLALLSQPVGLRTVLSALTVPRLPQYAEFVYRNLPFVMQVAFMGMETTGLAEQNLDRVWIDPYDYRETLAAAVRRLTRRMVPVSIYNHPLCVLTPDTRQLARNSITTWKQFYPPVCEPCSKKSECGGVFGTGVKISSHLQPL
ncbi:MAG: His-Xaa-Ser system radical SAM maturase HxsC [Thermodesulfobacteriota bacterium]